MDGVFIRKIVTASQLEEIRKADFVELRLETTDGSIGEKITFYSADVICEKN